MIVQFRNKLEKVQKEDIETRLIQNGWKPFYIDTEKTILITEHNFPVSQYIDSSLTERVLEMDTPYQLVNRVFRPEGTIVRVGSVEIGASSLVVIAGPCAVESESQLFRVAEIVKRAGGHMLRGGAYKPRTSPYSFQGLGEEGLKLLARAREKFDLPVVTEATSPENADTVAQYADVIQIGARNMQNFELLKKVGRLGKPVLLKRGMSATIEDLLNAAEYILSWGNFDVILCERGIRTIERLTRNTLDLTAISILKDLSHLPVIVDPSHGTGLREKVIPMARAAVACGADGVIVEVHPEPEKALSDGPQSLYPEQFRKLMNDLEIMSILTERTLQKEGKKVRQNLLSDGTGEEPVVITVAFLGEAGSFSSQVARQTFSRDMQYLSCTSFRHIFESVMKGNATHGILPLENTITGSIHGNYELLLEYPEVSVVGERFIKVSQHFALYPGTSRDNIEVLFAHPQGFAQCSRFLETLKRKRIMNVGNTEEAARRTAEFGMGAACITSSESITKYYLTLVEEDIEDQIRNFTRFIIFSRFHRPSLDNDKISCVFALQDRPGTLYECLKVFSEHSINIIKLESKPIPGKPWEYLFYVDWEGNMLEDRYQKAVDELRTKTVFLRILGCYKNMWKK